MELWLSNFQTFFDIYTFVKSLFNAYVAWYRLHMLSTLSSVNINILVCNFVHQSEMSCSSIFQC